MPEGPTKHLGALRSPADVATSFTADFLSSRTPAKASLLEIGCGEGEVALELSLRGFRVTGIDSDPESVERARAKGVPTVLASWPDWSSSKVDAIAFTRSLHHISPLDRAIRTARNTLQKQGMLLIEDFEYDSMDERTIHWFMQLVDTAKNKRLLNLDGDEFISILFQASHPLEAWHQDHDHDLHSFEAITAATQKSFMVRESTSVPYLFRYLIPAMVMSEEGAVFVDAARREEERLGDAGDILLVGRRIVAATRP
jgi:SAM-dependent methyltransferase